MMSQDYKINLFLDWYKNSPKVNLPFGCKLSETLGWNIVHIEPYGRCIVATRDIAENEVLFLDHPLLTGPKQHCGWMCLGCYKQLYEEDLVRCSKCGWSLCSKECETKGLHVYECPVLAAKGYKPQMDDFSDENPMYESILPLRCLLLKKHFPVKWNTFIAMESHEEYRQKTEAWALEQKNVCDFLHEKTGVEEDDRMIHIATGILDVNCHELRSNIPGSTDEYKVRGLYPLCAMMSHDCLQNTHHTVCENMSMLVIASQDIKKGSLITGTYTHILSGTIERRRHLKYGKYFDCMCKRCWDPTELGTYFSAIKCSKCDGYLLPCIKEDSNAIADFICEKCSALMRGGIVNRLTNTIILEIQAASEYDPMSLEKIYEKYKKVLHPNHYHIIGLKHSLSQMYGRVDGFMLADLTILQIQRKVECCRDILFILSRIDTGVSRLKGLTLYEMHAPLLLRANRAFQSTAMTKRDFLEALNESLGLLNGAIYNLRYEPASSFEGEIFKIAKGSAEELTKWILTVENLPPSRFLEVTPLNDVETDLTLEALLKKIEEY